MSRGKRGGRRTGQTLGSESFAVSCVCGERMEGRRRSESQVLICPSCGGSVFVLGESPLPLPKPRERQARGAEAREDLPVHPRAPRWKARARLFRRRLRAAIGGLASLRRFFTIPVLVAAAVVGVVAATVVWQSSRRSEQRLADEAEALGRGGLAALDRGDLSEAHRRLEAAVRRLAALKHGVADEREIRQAAAETDVVANLLSRPLSELLSEAASTRPGAARLAGRSVVLDCEPKWDDAGMAAWEGVGFLGDEPVRVDLGELTVFRSADPARAQRVLLGAKMAGLERTAAGWRLSLDAESGVWLTHPAVLEHLGLTDRETLAVAAGRRESLGLPPWRRER